MQAFGLVVELHCISLHETLELLIDIHQITLNRKQLARIRGDARTTTIHILINLLQQGCTRFRPCPFKHPSPKYFRLQICHGWGVNCRILVWEEGSIARFSGAKRSKRCPMHQFRKSRNFARFVPKLH